MILDSGRQQLFLSLVSPKAKVQLCSSVFLYKTVVHQLLPLISEDKLASTLVVGWVA